MNFSTLILKKNWRDEFFHADSDKICAKIFATLILKNLRDEFSTLILKNLREIFGNEGLSR